MGTSHTGISVSLKDAVNDVDAEQEKKVMELGIVLLQKRGMVDQICDAGNIITMPYRWVDDIKKDVTGQTERHRAPIVAKEYNQQYVVISSQLLVQW